MQQQKPQPSLLQALDAGLVVQLQALTAQLTAAASANPMHLNPLDQRVSSFNKVRNQGHRNGVEVSPRDIKGTFFLIVNAHLCVFCVMLVTIFYYV